MTALEPVRLPPLVEPGGPLTPSELARYSRHLLLPEVGEVGQRRLRDARVCVVGAGGLGAPVLQYLAAAGVGTLGVVDDDQVELSNLQRQVVHRAADLGRAKVDSAADAVAAIAPDLTVVRHRLRLDEGTVDLLADYDVVVDGTDSFATRYLVNDACVRLGLPEVWGSVLRFHAQVSVFWGRPRVAGVPPVQLRDLFPEPPPAGEVPSCAQAGVLGALCGQVGTVMATEVVKLVTGIGRPLLGRVLLLDALEQRWTEVPLLGAAAGAGVEAGARADHPAAASGPAVGATVPPPSRVGGAPAEVPAVPAVGAPATDPVPALTVAELAAVLGRPDAPLVVDVRDDAERATLPGPPALGVPLDRVLAGTAAPELAAFGRPVVVTCRSGARSEVATRALRAAGVDATNLTGGALAWLELAAGQRPGTGGAA